MCQLPSQHTLQQSCKAQAKQPEIKPQFEVDEALFVSFQLPRMLHQLLQASANVGKEATLNAK